jgi:hypothetical protein
LFGGEQLEFLDLGPAGAVLVLPLVDVDCHLGAQGLRQDEDVPGLEAVGADEVALPAETHGHAPYDGPGVLLHKRRRSALETLMMRV